MKTVPETDNNTDESQESITLSSDAKEALKRFQGSSESTCPFKESTVADKYYFYSKVRDKNSAKATLDAFTNNNERQTKTADKANLSQTIIELKDAADCYDSVLALKLIALLKKYSLSIEANELMKEIIFELESYDYEGAISSIIKLEESLL